MATVAESSPSALRTEMRTPDSEASPRPPGNPPAERRRTNAATVPPVHATIEPPAPPATCTATLVFPFSISFPVAWINPSFRRSSPPPDHLHCAIGRNRVRPPRPLLCSSAARGYACTSRVKKQIAFTTCAAPPADCAKLQLRRRLCSLALPETCIFATTSNGLLSFSALNFNKSTRHPPFLNEGCALYEDEDEPSPTTARLWSLVANPRRRHHDFLIWCLLTADGEVRAPLLAARNAVCNSYHWPLLVR